MNREVIATGRTVDEALDKAYEQLGISRDEAQFEILDLPKKGFLGLGASPAKVRVFIEVSKAQCAVDYLQSIFHQMGLDQVQIDVTETENCANITLSGDGLGVLIGRRGETLDALQYLAGLVANRLEGDYYRIVVDSGNYREKREKTLENLAKKLSSQVIRTDRSVTLEPMNPYERRIIHMTVHDIEGITSWSIGSEPYRRVVIGTSKDGHITYNNRRDSGRRDSRGGSYSRGRSYQRRPRNDRPVTTSAPDREQKKDMDTAPLYGRIDKKSYVDFLVCF